MIAAIRQGRRSSALSNGQIAALAGVDPGQTSRILDGKFRTFSGNVMRICTVLGIDPTATGAVAPSPRRLRKDVAWARLEDSVRRAWDETPRGADRLIAVIDAVAAIRPQGRRIRADPDASAARGPAK